MRAYLQKDNQFGEDGPQSGARIDVVEIRKIDGEYWAFGVRIVEQDVYQSYVVPLDYLMAPHTEETQTYWSTA